MLVNQELVASGFSVRTGQYGQCYVTLVAGHYTMYVWWLGCCTAQLIIMSEFFLVDYFIDRRVI